MIQSGDRGVLATLCAGVMLLSVGCEESDSGTGPGEGLVEVEVTPSEERAESIGEELSFEARALDADGEEVEDVTVEWSSGDPEILEHREEGRFVSVAEGSTTVEASVVYEGVAGPSGSATVEVVQVPAAIEVRPDDYTLWAVNQMGELEVTVVDAAGTTVEGGADRVDWSVEDPDVVEVNEGGTLIARGDGSTEVTGAIGDESGSATVSVEASFELRACAMDPDSDANADCETRSVTVHHGGG